MSEACSESSSRYQTLTRATRRRSPRSSAVPGSAAPCTSSGTASAGSQGSAADAGPAHPTDLRGSEPLGGPRAAICGRRGPRAPAEGAGDPRGGRGGRARLPRLSRRTPPPAARIRMKVSRPRPTDWANFGRPIGHEAVAEALRSPPEASLRSRTGRSSGFSGSAGPRRALDASHSGSLSALGCAQGVVDPERRAGRGAMSPTAQLAP